MTIKRSIKKQNFADDEISFFLTELASLMNLFKNDLLFLHHHAKGDKFDTIHEITDKLYHRASDDLDTLAELALRWNEEVGNFSDTTSVYYEPCRESFVDWSTFVSVLANKGDIIINSLQFINKSYPSDVLSVIDDIVAFWDKEINYKNAARKAIV